MTEGWVFDIQRFSTHDGPGIRTTVFLKGCGLRCLWCHNPESWAAGPQLQWYGELCIACGRCLEVCDAGARSLKGDGLAYDRAECRACGACAAVCPAEAARMVGGKVTAQAVVEEVLRDRPFYESSGGGVTLSGGEPLLQAEFAAAILRSCADAGIDTAIETAGHVPWLAFEQVLPSTHRVYFDLKLMDDPRHREATGVGIELIVANAQRVGQLAKTVVVRMPVVPGINDSSEDVRAVARFAKSMPNVEALELMRFHALASRKAAALGLSDWAEGQPAVSAEKMEELCQAGVDEGLESRLG